MKKVLALILALAMIFTLAACGSKTGSLHLVSIDDAHIDQLIASSPYYAKSVIGKDVYGTAGDAQTVAIAAMILVSNDLSEDTVYEITKTIFDGKANIEHGKAADLDLGFATSVTSVPFHAGAAKYYAEQGITVDSVAAGSSSASDLTFKTGGESGTYYAYGTVLAQYVSANTGLNITAVTGNGSKANVEDLDAGTAQLVFCQSDVMSYAYSGTNLFDKAVGSFSVLGALYMEQVQIATLNDKVQTVADLKGKTVSVGAQGSGVYFNAVDVLGAYGMTLKDIKPVYQSFGDSAESLKDGKIDAAFIVAGAPTTAVSDLAASKK